MHSNDSILTSGSSQLLTHHGRCSLATNAAVVHLGPPNRQPPPENSVRARLMQAGEAGERTIHVHTDHFATACKQTVPVKFFFSRFLLTWRRSPTSQKTPPSCSVLARAVPSPAPRTLVKFFIYLAILFTQRPHTSNR